MNQMYAKINKLCNDADIKVGRMAIQAGVSKSALTDLKMGRSKSLSIGTLTKIANFFDIDVNYLLGEIDEPNPTHHNVSVIDEDDNLIVLDDETLEYIDSLRSRPEMKMLFSVSKKATKDDIIKAVKIIEALKDESK